MRICVVTVAGYVHGIGGMQDHTVDLVRGLVAAGNEVTVITARHPDGRDEAEYAGATWHFVDSPSVRERLPMRHPGWLRLSADTFESLHARHRFDVVHSESTSALGLVNRSWHRRVPMAVKFHGNYLTFARGAVREVAAGRNVVREAKGLVWISGSHFLTRGNWYAFRSCESMVPSHAQLRDTTRSHLLRRSRVHVVPNGIDVTTFSPGDQEAARRELGLAPGLLFTWIGRMYPGKAVDLAIDGLARSGVDASLLLVGDGESRHDLERLATSTGLGSRVIFVGSQPRERLPSYLRASDVLVFPSRVPEAAGLAALQAMGCGIPVIAATSGALPEIIGPSGTTGELVASSDVSALSRAISTLAIDEARRHELGRAGRQRVLDEYTIDRMVERTLRVYAVAGERFRSATATFP